MKNKVLKIFNKRVLIFAIVFETIVIIMTSMLVAEDISLKENII